MEEEFSKLVSNDKNTVDGIIQWLKDCRVIDNAITEDQVRRSLGDVARVDHDAFVAALREVTQNTNAVTMAEDLIHAATELDEIFAKIQRAGKNNIDLLVRWLSTSNMLNDATEAKVQRLFEGADAHDVQLAQFKQVVATLAAEQMQNVRELVQSLVSQGPKLFDLVSQGFGSKN